MSLFQLLLIVFHDSRYSDGNGSNSTFEVFPPSLKANKFAVKLFIALFSLAVLLVDEETGVEWDENDDKIPFKYFEV